MTPERFARFDQALSTESHRPNNPGARKESNEERRPWPPPGRNSGIKRARFSAEQIITMHNGAEGVARSLIVNLLAKRRRREVRRLLGERSGKNREQFDELVKDLQSHRLQPNQ